MKINVPGGRPGESGLASSFRSRTRPSRRRFCRPPESSLGVERFETRLALAAPDAPTAVSGWSADGQVTLRWTAPANDGGAAITGYEVAFSATGGTTWAVFENPAPTATTVAVTGLTNGTDYVFRVSAVNADGKSQPSAVSAAVTPRTHAAWAAKIGSDNNVFVEGFSAATDGSALVTGYFHYTATFGGTTLTGNQFTPFLAKLNPNGSYAWANTRSDTGQVGFNAVATFGDGSALVTGSFSGSVTFGSTTLVNNTGHPQAIFVKFKPDGSSAWATKAGGSRSVSAAGASVSTFTDGSAIVTGSFSGTTTFGGTALTATYFNDGGSPKADVFVAKLNADGSFAWVTRAGGLGQDFSTCISPLGDGSALVTGAFQSSATFGDLTVSGLGGYFDVFVAKVTAQGSFAWVTAAGSSGLFNQNVGAGVTAFADGSSMVTGSFSGVASFGGETLVRPNASPGAFVAKLNSAGTFVWAKQVGSTGTSQCNMAALSATTDGAAYVVGDVQGACEFGPITLASGNPNDYQAFVAKVNSDGSFRWVTKVCGRAMSQGKAVAALPDGSVVVAGMFMESVAFGGITLTNDGNEDVMGWNGFIARFSASETDVPGAPITVTGVRGDGKVTLSWTAPEADGGAAIIDYVIECSDDGGQSWRFFSRPGPSADTSAMVTSLVNGRAYVFRVSATNVAGRGAPSVVSAAVIPGPTITVSGSLAALSTTYGTASLASSVSVVGGALVADVVATAPPGFEVSIDTVSWGPTATLRATAGAAGGTVSVRLAARTAAGSYTGSVSLASAGAAAVDVAIPASNVRQKTLTVTGVNVSPKTYDATVAAALDNTVAVLSGVVSGDTLTLVTGAATGVFGDPAVGGGKPVTASGYSFSGTAAANYELSQPALTGTITPKGLTVAGATAVSRAYDGTRLATIAGVSLVGVVVGDDVTVTGGGTFAQAGVGTGIAVTAALGITGVAAANYTLAQPAGLSASITARQLTVTGAAAVGRAYDGTTRITVTGGVLSGVVEGESVTLGGTPSGSVATAAAGPAKSVVVAGYVLGGTGGANYTLAQPTGLTVDVTAKSLTITGLSISGKTYDGTPAAVLTGTATYAGLVSGESFQVATSGPVTAAFRDAAAGVGKPVDVTGYVAPTANYALVAPALAATISPRPVTVVGLAAQPKTYDATATATITGSATVVGGIGGDDVSIAGLPVGEFNSRNTGTNRPVTVTGLSLTGAQAANYSLTPLTLSATITAKILTVQADDKTRIFGRANPPLTATITGFAAGDSAATALIGRAALTTAARAASQAGAYPIAAAAGTLRASNGNYGFAFQKGVMTVIAVPGAPSRVAVTAGSRSITLTWVAPVRTGNAAISDYLIQYSSNNGATWRTFEDGVSASTSAAVTGLAPNVAHVFRVRAVNAAGSGAFSPKSVAARPL